MANDLNVDATSNLYKKKKEKKQTFIFLLIFPFERVTRLLVNRKRKDCPTVACRLSDSLQH